MLLETETFYFVFQDLHHNARLHISAFQSPVPNLIPEVCATTLGCSHDYRQADPKRESRKTP